MNSILRYFKQNLHIVLFILLEILCITLIVRNNIYQSSYYFNSSKKASAFFLEINTSIVEYFNLKNKYEGLIKENVALRKQLKSNYVTETKQIFVVNDTTYKQRYKYLSAQIISYSTNRADNYMTINKGRSSGIVKGMGVFNSLGVVGVVERVSENYAILNSLLNINKFKLATKIKELNYVKGRIQWDGKDPFYMNLLEINKYEPMKVGFHLVTSSYTKIFPENIPIGTIESIKKNQTPYFEIKVKTSANFGSLQDVYIVVDLFKDEIDALEQLNFNVK